MPVHAVRCAGKPTLSAGSAMTSRGAIAGWATMRLTRVAVSVMTAPPSISEPVPAVVGTVMIGGAGTGAVLGVKSGRHS